MNERIIGVGYGGNLVFGNNSENIEFIPVSANDAYKVNVSVDYGFSDLADSMAYSIGKVSFADSHTVAADPSPYDNTITAPLSLESLDKLIKELESSLTSSPDKPMNCDTTASVGYVSCGPCEPNAEYALKRSKLDDDQKELLKAGIINVDGALTSYGKDLLLRIVFEEGTYEEELLAVAESINERD